METVGVFEAKTNLSGLLERVASGESITISKRGVPVAVLSPAPADSLAKRRAAIEDMKKVRKDRGMSDEEIVSLIREGRKY